MTNWRGVIFRILADLFVAYFVTLSLIAASRSGSGAWLVGAISVLLLAVGAGTIRKEGMDSPARDDVARGYRPARCSSQLPRPWLRRGDRRLDSCEPVYARTFGAVFCRFLRQAQARAIRWGDHSHFKIGHDRPVRDLFTNPFSASTFRKSSPGSSIGVSAMNAACFNR